MKQEIKDNDPRVLMLRAKNGDNNAFGLVYELYFTPVFRYVYLRINNKKEAEDLTQSIFLKVFQSLYRFEEMKSPPLAYFFTVARNAVFDHCKKKKEVVFADVEAMENRPANQDTNPARIADENEKNLIVSGLIKNNLTDEQKEVVALKFTSELSNKEISAIIGKNESAIRQIQCRALKKLREGLNS